MKQTHKNAKKLKNTLYRFFLPIYSFATILPTLANTNSTHRLT